MLETLERLDIEVDSLETEAGDESSLGLLPMNCGDNPRTTIID
jgi:hypothetical protein